MEYDGWLCGSLRRNWACQPDIVTDLLLDNGTFRFVTHMKILVKSTGGNDFQKRYSKSVVWSEILFLDK